MITFRKRQEIQKIMEMEMMPREIRAVWCSHTHSGIEGKFWPSLASCPSPPPALLTTAFLPFTPPDPLYFCSFSSPQSSPSSLHPSFALTCSCVSFFPPSSHPIPWKGKGRASNTGLRVNSWVDCIREWPCPLGDFQIRGVSEGADEICIGHSSWAICSRLLRAN